MGKRKYAKVVGGQIVAIEIKDSPSSVVNPDDGGPVWRPYTKADNPAHDPQTQTLEPAVVTITPTEVTVARAVRDLTAQELDARKEQVLPREVDVAFRVMFNHENRIRALESKGALTTKQFRNALKAML